MYLGGIQGLQGDLGWAFDRSGGFKPYIAASFTTMRIDATRTLLNYTGLGGVYGFNRYGFSFQTGLYGPIGQINAAVDSGDVSQLKLQLGIKLGYTFIR